MLAKVMSASVIGLDAIPVEVEMDIASEDLPNFFLVGLPDKVIKLARTIANMEGAEQVLPHHIAEALQDRLKIEPV